MASIGKRKAAMLLMGLDAGTVAKLLEGLPAEDIQEIALELARIDASGQRNAKKEAKVAQEFCNSLRADTGQRLAVRSFF
ncbi:MAG: magnesium and cobalt transport protein CorA, partial [Planctomycetota bacterium]